MTDSSSLAADYRAAGFSNRLGAGRRPALLIVDALVGYTDPQSPLFLETGADAVAAMVDTLAIARARQLDVVFTRVAYRPGGHDGGVFRRKVPALDLLTEGNHYSDIVAELAPDRDDVVLTKEYASAFVGTSLLNHLTSRHIDTVIVVGFSTSGCVRATAVDACQYGFIPLVVSDAVADRNAGPHDANLFDLDAKYADVVAVSELEATLDAGTSR